jgi:inhibitor of KinA sporulation pathway (predicted exonuclease)
MKKMLKLLKGHKYVAFLDFEGTQFSHEMIAIGAVLVSVDKEGKIKKWKKPFKRLVKAKNKIGKYVSDMTGITQKALDEQGMSFAQAMNDFKKYMGLHFKKASFVTFGNHDMRILGQSIAYNIDFPKEICSQIQKNYIDYSVFISEFIRDEKGNPLSLVHNCELFDVELTGPHHDPSADAINLAKLYDAFLNNKEKVVEQYKKSLLKVGRYPEPIKNVVSKLLTGEPVVLETLENEIREYIK